MRPRRNAGSSPCVKRRQVQGEVMAASDQWPDARVAVPRWEQRSCIHPSAWVTRWGRQVGGMGRVRRAAVARQDSRLYPGVGSALLPIHLRRWRGGPDRWVNDSIKRAPYAGWLMQWWSNGISHHTLGNPRRLQPETKWETLKVVLRYLHVHVNTTQKHRAEMIVTSAVS